MTLLDLGPKQPGPASESRSLNEDDIPVSSAGARVSGRAFWIWFSVIVVALSVVVYILKS